DARLHTNDARFRVPLQNAIHPLEIDEDVLMVERGVAVTVAAASESDCQVVGSGCFEDPAQLGDGAGAVDVADAAAGAAPGHYPLQPVWRGVRGAPAHVINF